MNVRNDIYEKVKFMLKETPEIKINYSVSPEYIGKYVEIDDFGDDFNIILNNRIIAHWVKASKKYNYNREHYLDSVFRHFDLTFTKTQINMFKICPNVIRKGSVLLLK